VCPTGLSTTFLSFVPTPTTAIYTLSLHDALPIFRPGRAHDEGDRAALGGLGRPLTAQPRQGAIARAVLHPHHLAAVDHGDLAGRSEEHTSELQSRENLVCRLLLEKKNNGCAAHAR